MKKNINNTEIKFEHAPQEKIRFVENVWDEFVEKVLQIEGVLATDESYLADFHGMFDDIRSIVSEDGDYYVLEWKYRNDTFHGEWKTKRKRILKSECVDYKKLYIERTKVVFGVNITAVYNKPLPEVMQFISKNRNSI